MVLSTARHSARSAGPPGHRVVRSEGDDERSICAPRIVIGGGGLGGLYAAKALSGKAVEVTLIDRKNHHTFQPLLYQVALAVLSPGEIACPRCATSCAKRTTFGLSWARSSGSTSGRGG